jgi:phage-related holin
VLAMKNFILNLYHSDPFIFVKGMLLFLLGPLNLQLGYLLIAIAIDLVFGIQVAKKTKTFKWKLLFSKVRSKIVIYALWIAMFHAFDMIAGLPNSARWAVVVMLAGMELMSAAKNTAKLGHGKLADALEALYLTLLRTNPTLNAEEDGEEIVEIDKEVTVVEEETKIRRKGKGRRRK